MKLDQITRQFRYLSTPLLHPIFERDWHDDEIPHLVIALKTMPGETLKRAAEAIHEKKHEEEMASWSRPSSRPPQDEFEEEIHEQARRMRLLLKVLQILKNSGEAPYTMLDTFDLDTAIAETVDWSGLPTNLQYLAVYADEFGTSNEYNDWSWTWDHLPENRKDELKQLSARVGRDMDLIANWLKSSVGTDAHYRVFALRAFLSEMCGEYMDF